MSPPSEISINADTIKLTWQRRCRVNIVSPGPIYHEGGFWEMVKNNQPDLTKRVEAVSEFNRLGTPQEVANAATFLASPAASNVTGANLRVGGLAIKTGNI
ncbi:MAG: hypothetical protein COB20_03480 [SAR86 cluster bacterium]|uniref:Short-chain dehydrogenase n=1 Tax=SAR86 cluster bacterium TaxID=2030880 RepID=A0A2A4XCA3_9GAMM|nr:MAG: hypothetical protein COB20_03480 [SAR86 cluster bacterium]